MFQNALNRSILTKTKPDQTNIYTDPIVLIMEILVIMEIAVIIVVLQIMVILNELPRKRTMFSLKYVITTITSITMITKMRNTTFGPTTSLIYDVEICKEPEPREVEDRWTQLSYFSKVSNIQ